MKLKAAAALLLSPLMVHAQANSPAQPQAASAPELHASLAMPAGLMSSAAAAAADTTTVPNSGAGRISTGVVKPKLIRTVPLEAGSASAKGLTSGPVEAVVSLTVDKTGKTENLKIEKSAGAELDREILAAVSQYQYRPATVSGEPTAIPLYLHVVVR
jgi:TonB family protein